MRILLAEDERSLSRAVTALLERSHYAVDAVYDGHEALDYLESGNYDALILDIMMPKMDGMEVLRRLRQQGNSIPVLMLTARGEVEDKVLGLDSGANDYLTKPFATEELLARLRAITRQSVQLSSQLTFGNLSLEQTTFELSTPAGSFRLANKEYQMMELFLRNPRQIIPAERFLERIWGYDSEVEVSVVWVYISYLRKKLTALQADVEIRASRNLGYSCGHDPEAAGEIHHRLHAVSGPGAAGDPGRGQRHELSKSGPGCGPHLGAAQRKPGRIPSADTTGRPGGKAWANSGLGPWDLSGDPI